MLLREACRVPLSNDKSPDTIGQPVLNELLGAVNCRVSEVGQHAILNPCLDLWVTRVVTLQNEIEFVIKRWPR